MGHEGTFWSDENVLYLLLCGADTAYQLLIAAVIRPHKLSDLKPDRSGGQKSDTGRPGLESECPEGCVPSGSARGKSTSFPFPASRRHVPSLAVSPASVFRASSTDLSISL